MTAFSTNGKLRYELPLWLSSSLALLCHAETGWMLREDRYPMAHPNQATGKDDSAEAMQDPDPKSLGDLLEAVAAMQENREAPGFSPPLKGKPPRQARLRCEENQLFFA